MTWAPVLPYLVSGAGGTRTTRGEAVGQDRAALRYGDARSLLVHQVARGAIPGLCQGVGRSGALWDMKHPAKGGGKKKKKNNKITFKNMISELYMVGKV